MIYKKLGLSSKQVSILGFGGLRLPKTACKGKEAVDDEKAFPILREAVRLGINYFDTGWGYINEDSQRAIGQALKNVRNKVYFANKLPLYLTHKPDDFWYYLDKELSLMETDYIDFFHFHMVGKAFWKKILDFKLIDAAEKAKSKGLIHHICFSFHDRPSLIKEMIDTYAFDAMLCQYNMVDQNNEEMMSYAKNSGVGVLVMGPTAGGNISAGGDEFLSCFPESPARTSTELAMRFVWANPDVDCVLSGIETLDMLNENVSYAKSADTITKEEREYVKRRIKYMEQISIMSDIYCTGCRYCQVCPIGIKPFVTITAYNRWKIWGLEKGARNAFGEIGKDPWQGTNPANCISCGKCSRYCPQKIDIPKVLKKAVKAFLNTN